MSIRSLAFVGASLALLACSSSNDASPSGTPADTGVAPADTGAPPDDTGGGGDDAPAAYPDGPYGIEIGNVFPDLTWDGYKDAKGDWTKISVHDFYDPDGSKGENAIYIVVSAQWCVPCQGEAKQLARLHDLYQPSGAPFLSAMLQKSSGDPSDQSTVDAWIKTYMLDFDVVAAPTPTAGTDGMMKSNIVPPKWAIPRNYVINPRDMKIFRVILAALPTDAPNIPSLSLLLKANGVASPP
jgi:hypothetical protein